MSTARRMGGAKRYPSIAIGEYDVFREGLNPSYGQEAKARRMGGAKRYPSIVVYEDDGFRKGSTHPTAAARSTGADQPDRFVPFEQIEQMAQRLAARRAQGGIARQHQRGIVARGADIFAVKLDAGDLEGGQA